MVVVSHVSARLTLGIVTVVLVLVVSGVVVVSGLAEHRPAYLSPADTVGSAAPLGETVAVGGTVVSAGDTRYVIEDADDDSPQRLTVVLADGAEPTVTVGPGVFTVFTGTLVAPALLQDATIELDIGPSKAR